MDHLTLAGLAVIAAYVSRHRCGVWALAGLLTGCAAYAQDAAPPAAVLAGGTDVWLLEVVRAGGLPAVLAVTGWMFGRGGLPVTISLGEKPLVVRLADEDRKLLENAVDALRNGRGSR